MVLYGNGYTDDVGGTPGTKTSHNALEGVLIMVNRDFHAGILLI